MVAQAPNPAPHPPLDQVCTADADFHSPEQASEYASPTVYRLVGGRSADTSPRRRFSNDGERSVGRSQGEHQQPVIYHQDSLDGFGQQLRDEASPGQVDLPPAVCTPNFVKILQKRPPDDGILGELLSEYRPDVLQIPSSASNATVPADPAGSTTNRLTPPSEPDSARLNVDEVSSQPLFYGPTSQRYIHKPHPPDCREPYSQPNHTGALVNPDTPTVREVLLQTFWKAQPLSQALVDKVHGK